MNHCAAAYTHTLTFHGQGALDPELPRVGFIVFQSKIEHAADAVDALKQAIGKWAKHSITGDLATEGGTVFTLDRLIEHHAFQCPELIDALHEKGISVQFARLLESDFTMHIDGPLADPQTREHFATADTH